MRKYWEYLTTEIDWNGTAVLCVDTQKWVTLDYYGDQGWELVSYTLIPKGNRPYGIAIFKREKE